MAMVLEDAGYAVDRAATVNEAVDAITAGLPALVLLDLSLGKADGLDVLHRMRAAPDTSAIPVVALSGRVAQGDVDRAIAAGCEAHLAADRGARAAGARYASTCPPAEPGAGRLLRAPSSRTSPPAGLRSARRGRHPGR